MSIGHSNALVKFSEGEEVVEGDFNALLAARVPVPPAAWPLVEFDLVESGADGRPVHHRAAHSRREHAGGLA
jgi:hypothetical protein